jgi:hypothetical protein
MNTLPPSVSHRERIGQIECCGTVCCCFVRVLFIDLESRRAAIGELGKNSVIESMANSGRRETLREATD